MSVFVLVKTVLLSFFYILRTLKFFYISQKNSVFNVCLYGNLRKVFLTHSFMIDFDKIYVNYNIMNKQIFNLIKYDLNSHWRSHFYVYFNLKLHSYGQPFILVSSYKTKIGWKKSAVQKFALCDWSILFNPPFQYHCK